MAAFDQKLTSMNAATVERYRSIIKIMLSDAGNAMMVDRYGVILGAKSVHDYSCNRRLAYSFRHNSLLPASRMVAQFLPVGRIRLSIGNNANII
jgi:hypothetical protein